MGDKRQRRTQGARGRYKTDNKLHINFIILILWYPQLRMGKRKLKKAPRKQVKFIQAFSKRTHVGPKKAKLK